MSALTNGAVWTIWLVGTLMGAAVTCLYDQWRTKHLHSLETQSPQKLQRKPNVRERNSKMTEEERRAKEKSIEQSIEKLFRQEDREGLREMQEEWACYVNMVLLGIVLGKTTSPRYYFDAITNNWRKRMEKKIEDMQKKYDESIAKLPAVNGLMKTLGDGQSIKEKQIKKMEKWLEKLESYRDTLSQDPDAPLGRL